MFSSARPLTGNATLPAYSSIFQQIRITSPTIQSKPSPLNGKQEVPIKEADNVSIHKLLAIIKRRKLALALPTLLTALAFGIYAYHVPSRFEAKALLTLAPPTN